MEQGFIILSVEELKQLNDRAAEIGAATALERSAEERRSFLAKSIDKKLRNTKLLLRNYRLLKESADKSIYGQSQMKDSAADVLASMLNLYDDEVIIDSIKRSATRTAIIVAHIEKMMDIFKAYCEKSYAELDMRRYNILFDVYMAAEYKSIEEVAEERGISPKTVYRDIDQAVEGLAALIFGADGLRVE